MLELKNISKKFGKKEILSNFSLTIPEKQILAIVGPSGGGKTTLLRMFDGLETISRFSAFSSLIRYGELDFITHQDYGNV